MPDFFCLYISFMNHAKQNYPSFTSKFSTYHATAVSIDEVAGRDSWCQFKWVEIIRIFIIYKVYHFLSVALISEEPS